jgi:hypothetical protein
MSVDLQQNKEKIDGKGKRLERRGAKTLQQRIKYFFFFFFSTLTVFKENKKVRREIGTCFSGFFLSFFRIFFCVHFKTLQLTKPMSSKVLAKR